MIKKAVFMRALEALFYNFFCSLLAVFIVTVFLEYLYEINPKTKEIEATSYIFVIDESASMSSNDPNGLRYNAISEIMNSPENTLPYMVYAFSSESRILRDMGYLTSNEEEIPINCDGATSIRETTLRILQDYKDKKWSGGKNPKIIFLTDGFAQIWITVFYGLKAMSQNSTQLWKSTANLESVSVQLVLDPLINSL